MRRVSRRRAIQTLTGAAACFAATPASAAVAAAKDVRRGAEGAQVEGEIARDGVVSRGR